MNDITRRTLLKGLGGALGALVLPVGRLWGAGVPDSVATAGSSASRLPLLDRKLVMAHNMTFPLPLIGRQMDLRSYYPNGAAGEIGGLNLAAPMVLFNIPENIARRRVESLSLDDPEYFAYLDKYAEHEVRTAKLLGVDGFEFFFPLGLAEENSRLAKVMIGKQVAAADRLDLDFHFSLDLSHFGPMKGAQTQDERLDAYARAILDVMNAPGIRDSKRWLKTPDGRFVFFTYNPFPIVQGVKREQDLFDGTGGIRGGVEKIASAFAGLEARLGRPCAFVYRNFDTTPEYVECLLNYFPALTGWAQTYLPEEKDPWDEEMRRCKAHGKTFAQNVIPDLFMSKVDSKIKKKRLFTPDAIKGLPISDFTRYHVAGGLSKNFRMHLQQAVDDNLTLIDIATWNDYLEGHHLSPELNHDFGFAILLQYYKKLWHGQTPEQAIDKDVAAVFYKKHAKDAQALYFNIPIARMAWSTLSQKGWEELEKEDDHIEIVTLLTDDSVLYFRGKEVGRIGKGLTSTVLPLSAGKVSVRVERAGKPIIDFSAPEWITDHPYRYDRFTVTWSSESDKLYHEIFGKDAPRAYLDEYAEDAAGIPNWKKRYDFSKMGGSNLKQGQ